MGAPGTRSRKDERQMAERHSRLAAETDGLDLTPIPNWPRHSAGRDGSIWSTDSNWRGYGVRKLKTGLHRGYLVVRPRDAEAVRRRIPVHRLVAMTFLGPCPEGCDQVRHLDGNPLNNAANNLAWGSAADNADDRARHGRTAFGTREWWAENKHNLHLFAASGALYDALAELTRCADRVMRMLAEDGPKVVPHLLDSDDNAGEYTRNAIIDAYAALALARGEKVS